MKKKCSKCGVEKEVTRANFGNTPPKTDGSIGFRATCRICVSARTKQYDESNPDKLAVRLQKRKLSTVGDRSDIKQHYFTLLQTQNGLCRYCKEKLDSNYEIDHITPVSKNGDNKLSNLALSCRQCNREKHNKTLFEYIEWRLERNMFVAEDDFDNYKKNKPKSWVELLTPYLTSKNL